MGVVNMVDFDRILDKRIRFVHKGIITFEDLYKLNPQELSDMYGKYSKQLNEASLIPDEDKNDDDISLKMDAIKHVFEYKKKLIEEEKERIIKAENKRKILEVIQRKENEELSTKSKEELLKMLEEL